MSRCANCGDEWLEGSHQKYRVLTVASPYTARKAFPGKSSPTKQKICGSCRNDLTLRTVFKRSTRKRTWPTHTPKRPKRLVPDSTPTKAPPSKRSSSGASAEPSDHSEAPAATPTPTTPVSSFKDRAKSYIDGSQYIKAFRTLISNSSAAKAALHTLAAQEVRKEMVQARFNGASPLSSLQSPVSKERLDVFSWHAIHEEASSTLPLLVKVLEVAMPSTKVMARHFTRGPRTERRFLTEEEALQKRNARLSMMLGIIFYSRNPRRYSFIQAMMSVDLWLQGASHATVRSLNFLGVSQGVDAARNHVDNIRAGYDQKVVSWRLEAEASYGQQTRRRLSYGPEPAPPPAGYSVCFDNVQFQSHRKHQRKDATSEFIISSLAFATSHRVRASQSLVSAQWSPSLAADLDTSVFLPADPDFKLQRADLGAAVKRILVLHLAAFTRCKNRIARTTPHAYTEVMKTKSEVVSLGVIQGNPAATPDTIDVLDNLMAYVPVVGNRAMPVPCHGDGGTVESVIKAKRGRVLSCARSHLFRPLKEVPQEFHKEGLLMQDVMDRFFTQASRTDRGTLYNIKDLYQHKSARSQVMSNFQHIWDLLMFATEGMTVLLAMKFMGIADPDDIPDDLPDDLCQLDTYIEHLAADIVDRVWQETSPEDIHRARESYRAHRSNRDSSAAYLFCRCHTEKEETLVQCCNSSCPFVWLHLSCLEPPLVSAPPQDEDWYCSEACESADGYIYCTCQSRLSLDFGMVQCALKEGCHRYEWYHPSCLGKDGVDVFPENWFCSDQCSLAEQEDDGVLQHNLALLWSGLNLAVRRSAVREGDGERMLTYWRLDMLQFWESNHPRYLRISHTLLAYTGGFLSPAVAHEITWNRTVNSSGRDSGNIGLDQMNEFLNNEFKGMIKHCHGRYTPVQVQRCSQMIGPFKRELERLFQVCPGEAQHRKGGPKYREDIASFLREYTSDGLFDYCPPRSHSAFPNFARGTGKLRDPVHLGERLKELSIQMDNYRKLEAFESS